MGGVPSTLGKISRENSTNQFLHEPYVVTKGEGDFQARSRRNVEAAPSDRHSSRVRQAVLGPYVGHQGHAISSFTGKDRLFYFFEGLKPWAQAELQRQGVQDLASAQAAAERLPFTAPWGLHAHRP